jgi:hypothetical protein
MRNYSELHFVVIATIDNNAGITRGEVWRRLGKQPVRKGSAGLCSSGAAATSDLHAHAG